MIQKIAQYPFKQNPMNFLKKYLMRGLGGLAGFTTLTVLALSGCTQTPANPLPIIQPPSWYLQPPSDTALDLYGAGAGKTRELATQAALNDLATKLGVEVSSQFKLQHNSTNSAYQVNEETSEQKILTEVQATTFNQYQTLKTEQIAYDQFFVLVKTDKTSLAFSIRQSLEQHINRFLLKQKQQQALQGFSAWLFYESEQKSLPSFQRQLSIYQTLKPRSDDALYQSYLDDIANKVTQSQQATQFALTALQSGASQLLPTLENQITQSGFKVVEKKASNRIELQSSNNKATQAYGFTVLRSQVTLNTYQGSQKLGSNQFDLKGQGLTMEQAQINLINDFKTQLGVQPLNVNLGIKNPQ